MEEIRGHCREFKIKSRISCYALCPVRTTAYWGKKKGKKEGNGGLKMKSTTSQPVSIQNDRQKEKSTS